MKHLLLRRFSQIIGTLLVNSHFTAWDGNPQIYQGRLKGLVGPVLNCYACPSAKVSCPLGSIQHFAALKLIPFYVIGMLASFGLLLGKATCGWICPFGLLQDLEYKLGRKLKLPKITLPKWMSWGKYLFLVGLVILAPILSAEPGEFGAPGVTWFCKFCPQGAFQGGIPQVLLHPDLKGLLGWLFTSKIIILGLFIIAFLITKRPFCRVFCPLGAILGLFNKVSLLQFRVDESTCTHCNLCKMVCPVDISIYEDPNNSECIRCGDCLEACKFNSISVGTIFSNVAQKETKDSCSAD
ncbi:4Fe-4S binding protein [bacterium]|nr:4Fe-4S binding protein [bacterium]